MVQSSEQPHHGRFKVVMIGFEAGKMGQVMVNIDKATPTWIMM